METPDSKTSPPATTTSSLHERAEENLQYIRNLMESSSSFTGVSGKGYIVAGVSALIAAWIAGQQQTQESWFLVWMLELLFAGSLTFYFTLRKASSQGESLWSTTAKKVLFAFIPPMVVGAVLTLFFMRNNGINLLPGIWLSIYGAAVMTAGAYSVSIIPLMGAMFLVLGAGVLLFSLPGNLFLGLGMGGLHIAFGLAVWRNYGG